MRAKTVIIALLTGILFFMIWVIIDTSLKSNLFTELPDLVKIPWMEATLYDFYANVFCFCLWIFYKEQNVAKKILWVVFLVTMGSVATCVYLLKELFLLKEDEGLKTLLVRQNA